MEQIENWKEISGFPYEVSEQGRIRRSKITSKYSNSVIGKIIKPWKTGNSGYLAVTLIKDGKQYAPTVHKLVMEAFIGKRPNKVDIHHIDGDKHNNKLSNLGYISRSGNMSSLGYKPGPRPKLSEKDIYLIKFLSKGVSGKDLAKQFNCSSTLISRVINGME